jgi:hypothetical protein
MRKIQAMPDVSRRRRLRAVQRAAIAVVAVYAVLVIAPDILRLVPPENLPGPLMFGRRYPSPPSASRPTTTAA